MSPLSSESSEVPWRNADGCPESLDVLRYPQQHARLCQFTRDALEFFDFSSQVQHDRLI